MRYIGIDFGSKRVGVALSDEKGQFASPFTVLDFSNSLSKEVVEEIVTLAKKNAVTTVVLGESKNYKGEANTIMAKSLEFKKHLEEKGLIVRLEPEFMTSVAAERFQGKNDLHDASAAALILQSFLDTHHSAQ